MTTPISKSFNSMMEYDRFHRSGDFIYSSNKNTYINFGNYPTIGFKQGFLSSLGYGLGGLCMGFLSNIMPGFNCNYAMMPGYYGNYGNFGNFGNNGNYDNNTRTATTNDNNYLDPDNKKIADLIERVSNIDANTPTEDVNEIKSDIEKAIGDLDNVNKPADKKSLDCLKKLLGKLNNTSTPVEGEDPAPTRGEDPAPTRGEDPAPVEGENPAQNPNPTANPSNDNATKIQDAKSLEDLNGIHYNDLSDDEKTKFKDQAINFAKDKKTTPEELQDFLNGLDNEDLRKAIKESFYEKGYTNVAKDKVNADLLKNIKEIIDKSDVTDLTSINISDVTNEKFKATSKNNNKYNSTYNMEETEIDGEVIFTSTHGQKYVLQQNGDNYYLMQYKYHEGYGKEDIKINK